MQAFLDSECLPDAEDWQKCFLYGLQNSKLMVPIISEAGWLSIVIYLFIIIYSLIN